MRKSIKHIDWVSLDNIIITSSKESYYKMFIEQIKPIEMIF